MNGGVPTMMPISDGDNPNDFMCRVMKFHSDAEPKYTDILNVEFNELRPLYHNFVLIIVYLIIMV